MKEATDPTKSGASSINEELLENLEELRENLVLEA